MQKAANWNWLFGETRRFPAENRIRIFNAFSEFNFDRIDSPYRKGELTADLIVGSLGDFASSDLQGESIVRLNEKRVAGGTFGADKTGPAHGELFASNILVGLSSAPVEVDVLVVSGLRLRRRRKQGRIEAQSGVDPGATVYAGVRHVGQIVDARIGPDALLDALAVVPIGGAEPLRVGATDGPEFVVS